MNDTKAKNDSFALQFSEEDIVGSQRYVAGTQFFNYETFGALRLGGPIKLLSTDYFGLAVSVFFSNLMFCFIRSCVSPTLSNLLKMTPAEANAAQHLIEDMPACMSFFVGFVSDYMPISGYHRKSYMLIGWLWAAIMLLVMTGLMWQHQTSIPASVYILLAMSISFGTMLPYTMSEILLVELSQRESLQERGSLVARYQYVRVIGTTIGKIATLVLIKSPTMQQIQLMLLALSCAALIPLVAIALFLQEQRMAKELTLRQAHKNMRRTAQQKVVWSIVVFVIIFTFFMSFEFYSGENAIRAWSNVNVETSSKVITTLVHSTFTCVAICAWQFGGLNVGWPALFLWSPVLKFASSMALVWLTSLNIIRSPSLFWGMTAIMGLSTGLTRIYLPIVLTEIVEPGSEGTTVGLMLTFQKTLTMFVTTMAPKISEKAGWDVSSKMIKQDTQQVRQTVQTSLTVSYVVNLLSLPGLFFLPTQKLDAQQRRTYGGFTRGASLMLLVAFLVFFGCSLAVNGSTAYTAHTTSKWT